MAKKVSNNCSGKVNYLVCELVDHIDDDYKNNHVNNLYWTDILPIGPQMYVRL